MGEREETTSIYPKRGTIEFKKWFYGIRSNQASDLMHLDSTKPFEWLQEVGAQFFLGQALPFQLDYGTYPSIRNNQEMRNALRDLFFQVVGEIKVLWDDPESSILCVFPGHKSFKPIQAVHDLCATIKDLTQNNLVYCKVQENGLLWGVMKYIDFAITGRSVMLPFEEVTKPTTSSGWEDHRPRDPSFSSVGTPLLFHPRRL